VALTGVANNRATARTLHDLRARLAGIGADPGSRADLVIAAASLVLGLFSFATLVAVGYLDSTKLPWFDGWTHWSRYLRADGFWTFLFSEHNEHRIPVTRLLYLADEHWSSADTRLLEWATFLAQIGSALMLFRLACSSSVTLSIAIRTTILGLILAFLFAASQWINFTWTFCVPWAVVFSAAIGAFAALKNAVHDRPAGGRSFSAFWLTVSIIAGLISTGSLANGLLVWPLMVLMAVCIGLPRKAVGILAVVGLAVIAAYLHHWEHPASVFDWWMKTPEVMVFASAYLGAALDEPLVALTKAVGLDWESYRVPLSALAGALGAGWFCHLALLTFREPRARRPARIAILYVLTFLIASAVLTGIGRVQFPIKEALTSRYCTPSLLFWGSLVALAISASATGRRTESPEQGYRLRVAALIGAAFIGGLGQLPKVAYAVEAERYLSEGEYALINDVFVAEGWQRFSGTAPAATMIPVVRYFRDRHLASFSREWTRWIGDPVRAHFVIDPINSDCVGAWESERPVGGSFNPAVMAAGWGYDRRFNREPERIVITDGTGRIVGFAPLTRRRPDLLPAYPELSHFRVGWVSYLPASVSADMTAYLLLGDGRTLCRGGGAHVPGSYVTAAAARADAIIGGVDVTASGMWVKDRLPPGAPTPPFATETWSSPDADLETSVLRLGPVRASAGMSVGLPLMMGPGTPAIRVSAIERRTGEVLAMADPSTATPTWDLWRLDLPTGAPDMVVDYVVEQGHHGAGNRVTVGQPRLIKP
jgi:hypothetical protein